MSSSLDDLYKELGRSQRKQKSIIDEMKPLIDELGDDTTPNSRIPKLENDLNRLGKDLEKEGKVIYDASKEIIECYSSR